VSTPVPVERAAALLAERFFSRTDVVAALMPWGSPQPAPAGASLPALLRAHLARSERAQVPFGTRGGRARVTRIGTYSPAPDGTTAYLCLDVDGPDHPDGLADPWAAAMTALARAEALGVPAYLERSAGGRGVHLWVFFPRGTVPAPDARALGRHLAARHPDGDRSRRGVEVFPKQDRLLEPGRVGHMVWLPWWHGSPDGNLFVRPEGGRPAPYFPDELTPMSADSLNRVLASLPAEVGRAASPVLPAGRAAGADEAQRIDAALARLDPDSPYDTWLSVGMALHAWNPVAGLDLWERWSARGAKHRPGETAAKWGTFRGDGITLGTLFALARADGAGAPPAPKAGTERPVVRVTGRQLRDVIADAWAAVLAAQDDRGPRLYSRGGTLACLCRASGPHAAPRIEEVSEARAYGLLLRAATWVGAGDDPPAARPPREIARDFLVFPHPSLPALDAVVAAPYFDERGVLVARPGYNAAARVYLHESGARADVPSSPTPADVEAARALIVGDLFADFPFAAPSDRAHAVAALLLPFARRMVDGPTPLHLIEAPVPGTGKSLLAETIAQIAQGRSAEPMTLGRDEEETRKKITAVLGQGRAIVLWDNVRDGLSAASLAAALTARSWSDRVLGHTRMIDVPNQATWIATANNPDLPLEIARRAVRIRLDPRMDRPWRRDGFRHDPLRAWVAAHRGALVGAVLLLIQAWIAAGRPVAARRLGSFEAWSQVIGGILAVAGIAGFLDNLDELYELADADGREWRELVAAWHDRYGEKWVAVGELHDLAVARDLMGGVLGDGNERSRKTRLGRALIGMRGRVFGKRVVALRWDGHAKRTEYRLGRPAPAQVDPITSPGPAVGSAVSGTESPPAAAPAARARGVDA
jgi:hypothetical protein